MPSRVIRFSSNINAPKRQGMITDKRTSGTYHKDKSGITVVVPDCLKITDVCFTSYKGGELIFID